MKLYKTKENEVYYYFLKDGSKRFMYRHFYYDMFNKRREKSKSGFKTLKEAQRSLLETKVSLLDSDIKPINNDEITVNQLMDLWFTTKERTWKKSTKGNYKNCVNVIKKYIGNYRLNKLSRTIYEREFINKMFDDGYKGHTVLNRHEVFKAAVNFAVEDEMLDRNRYSTIRVKFEKDKNNFLAPEQLNVVLKYAKKHCQIHEYTSLLTIAYTGARKGETLALRWKDIDYNKNLIVITGTRDIWGDRSPKTKNSFRIIEVDSIVIKQLKLYEKWCKEIKMSFGEKHKKTDLVFISENNTTFHPHYPNTYLEKVYKLLNNDKIEIPRINIHGLRHTHATILINALVPPTDIATRLGNTLEMIYRVYAHSLKKVNDGSAAAFSNSLKSHVKSI